MAILKVHRISKSFPGIKALDDVSFPVERGEILGILGPSGCGKTTLLRVIAGLETPDSGQVLWEGQDLADTPPHQRDFGLMFQDYALFPHLNVYENVAFGLKMQGLSEAEVHRRVSEILELVGLGGYEDRDVNELSGGEQQRVALARSLAPNPRLLMLDEPLGSLDRTLRERLMEDIPRILKRVGVTAIYVTHDQEEAFAVSEQLVVMERGRIAQTGTPQEIYRRPANAFVARFLGMNNLFKGQVAQISPHLLVHTPLGDLQIDSSPMKPRVGEEVTLLIPPSAAKIADSSTPPKDNLLTGRVAESSFRGDRVLLLVQTPGGELSFTLPSTIHLRFQPGEEVQLRLESESLILLPPEGD